MAEYILARGAAQDSGDGTSNLDQSTLRSDLADGFRFPVLTSLLRDFAAMSEASPRSGKGSGRRGRKARAKVPCDECIAKASQKNEPSASLELCGNCTAALHRPRPGKTKEQANTRKVRKQSHTVIDTALGIHTEPVAMPCESALPVAFNGSTDYC